MTNQHIEIPSTASRLSANVRRLIDEMRQIQQLQNACADIIAQIASGNDWLALKDALGAPTEADAEAVYNLIVALDLNTYSYNAVIDRLG